MYDVTIRIEREEIIKSTLEIKIDIDNCNEEMAKEALLLTPENVSEFEKKWDIKFKPNTANILTEQEDINKNVKVIGSEKEIRDYNKTLERRGEYNENIGEIEFSISGSGSNYKYEENSISGTEIFIITNAKLFLIMKELNGLEVDDVKESYLLLSPSDKDKVKLQYLVQHFGAPSDEIGELYFEGDDGESSMLYWIDRLNSIRQDKRYTEQKYPYSNVEWEISDIKFDF